MASLTERMAIAERIAQLDRERRELTEMSIQFDFEYHRENDAINEVEGVETMGAQG